MEVIPRDGSELDKQLTGLYQLAQEIRAPFLEQAIFVEKLLEDIIAQYFCPEEGRRNLFLSLVINGTDLTFSTKILIFERLLILCYPDIIKKHAKLTGEIHKVRRFRNRIAHAMLDASPEFLSQKFTDRIQLVYQEDGRKKQQVVTVAERNERLAACTKIIMALLEIQKEIAKQNASNIEKNA